MRLPAFPRLLAILVTGLLAMALLSACGNKGPLKKPKPSITQSR